MASAHPRPQFSVDEWVFMVLKYTESGNVQKVSKALSELDDIVQTNNNGYYNKYFQYSFSLNRNVGNSGRSRTSKLKVILIW